MVGALEQARADGGEVFGGERLDLGRRERYYVAPAMVRMPAQTEWCTRRPSHRSSTC